MSFPNSYYKLIPDTLQVRKIMVKSMVKSYIHALVEQERIDIFKTENVQCGTL